MKVSVLERTPCILSFFGVLGKASFQLENGLIVVNF